MKHRIKAILFDLDDTLYDEMAFVSSGFLAVAHYLVDEHNLVQTPDKIQCDMLDLLDNQGRGHIFDEILHRYGLYKPQLASTLVDVYRTHQPELTLYPEVKQSLKVLKARGLCLGLITDGLYTVQQIKVTALELEKWLDIIIYTDELGREFWKPHPAAFQQALSQFQVEPKFSAYVGNDPTKDFLGPDQLGMLAIQIHRPDKESPKAIEANIHINNLNELLDLLDGNYAK